MAYHLAMMWGDVTWLLLRYARTDLIEVSRVTLGPRQRSLIWFSYTQGHSWSLWGQISLSQNSDTLVDRVGRLHGHDTWGRNSAQSLLSSTGMELNLEDGLEMASHSAVIVGERLHCLCLGVLGQLYWGDSLEMAGFSAMKMDGEIQHGCCLAMLGRGRITLRLGECYSVW